MKIPCLTYPLPEGVALTLEVLDQSFPLSAVRYSCRFGNRTYITSVLSNGSYVTVYSSGGNVVDCQLLVC